MTSEQALILGAVFGAWCCVGMFKFSINRGALTRTYGHTPNLLEEILYVLLWPLWEEMPR